MTRRNCLRWIALTIPTVGVLTAGAIRLGYIEERARRAEQHAQLAENRARLAEEGAQLAQTSARQAARIALQTDAQLSAKMRNLLASQEELGATVLRLRLEVGYLQRQVDPGYRWHMPMPEPREEEPLRSRRGYILYSTRGGRSRVGRVLEAARMPRSAGVFAKEA